MAALLGNADKPASFKIRSTSERVNLIDISQDAVQITSYLGIVIKHEAPSICPIHVMVSLALVISVFLPYQRKPLYPNCDFCFKVPLHEKTTLCCSGIDTVSHDDFVLCCFGKEDSSIFASR